jgi:hypothetical protein
LNGSGHEFLIACLQLVSLILGSLSLNGIFQLKYFQVFRQLDKRIIHSFLSLVPVPRRFACLHGMQILIDHVFFQRAVVQPLTFKFTVVELALIAPKYLIVCLQAPGFVAQKTIVLVVHLACSQCLQCLFSVKVVQNGILFALHLVYWAIV